MTLRLHDTATGDVRDFVPLHEGRAGIYVCGLTVQSEPHVGHVRSAVNFDVLRRWLTASGYDVEFIRNVTVAASANLCGATKGFSRGLASGRSNGRPRACLRRARKDFMCIHRAFRRIRPRRNGCAGCLCFGHKIIRRVVTMRNSGT